MTVSVLGSGGSALRLRARALVVPAVTDGTLLLLTLALVWQAFVVPGPSRDLAVFLRAGWQVVHGVDPYTPPTDPFLWHGAAFVYPYLTAFAFTPFALLPQHAAAVLWFALGGAALVAGVRAFGVRAPYAVPALLLAAPVVRSFQVGALNAFLFCAGALAWRYRDRPVVVAAATTVLVGSKLFLAPVLVWVALTRSRRTLVLSLAGTGAFLGLGFLVGPIGPRTFLRSLDALAVHEGLQGASAYHLAHLLLPHAVARLVPPLLGGALLAAAVVAGRRRPAVRDQLLFAASVLAALLATPVYWTHYNVLVALAVLALAPRASAVVAFAAASWVVSRPARLALAWQAVDTRFLLLAALLAAAVAVTAWPRRAAAAPA